MCCAVETGNENKSRLHHILPVALCPLVRSRILFRAQGQSSLPSTTLKGAVSSLLANNTRASTIGILRLPGMIREAHSICGRATIQHAVPSDGIPYAFEHDLQKIHVCKSSIPSHVCYPRARLDFPSGSIPLSRYDHQSLCLFVIQRRPQSCPTQPRHRTTRPRKQKTTISAKRRMR